MKDKRWGKTALWMENFQGDMDMKSVNEEGYKIGLSRLSLRP